MRRIAIAGTIAVALVTAALVGGSVRTTATAATPALRLTNVDGTDNVTAMSARAGTRTLYVTARDGEVWSLRNGKRSASPVLDLRDQVSQDGGERGLLGITFSPDGTRLYLDYTDRAGNDRVDEFTMRGSRVDAASQRHLLDVDDPQPNHNGGQLAFGPDGDLYIAMGDGGSEGDVGPGHAPGGNGQSLGTLFGKILRIDPTPSGDAPFTVPADNPFVHTDGAKPEIWAYGLRNPWRFSFDRANGDLWIGDVGQDEYEEIDHVAATDGRDAGKGDNFGWNRLEGDHPYQGRAPSDVVAPVHEISHDTGACAVIGGYVYRGRAIPELAGTYLFSDNCDGTIRTLTPDGQGGVRAGDTGVEVASPSSFGQANDGTLYVLSLANGVYKITA
jgi:glucose/arabinose dehydrogenase